jgi:hypothetical protein
MRLCDCNQVTSDSYTRDQCWTCWCYAHVRSVQREARLEAAGCYASPEEAIVWCSVKPVDISRSLLDSARRRQFQGTPSIVLEEGAGGIGDGLLGLLAVNGYQLENPTIQVVYRVGTVAEPWVRLFYGYSFLESLEHAGGDEGPIPNVRNLNIGYGGEQRTRYRAPRIERYCANVGTRAPAVPSLRNPDKVREAGKKFSGVVILAPFSNSREREYPVVGWLMVESLLRKAGHRTLVIASQDNEARTEPFKGEKLIGATPELVAGSMLNSRCVIACDSGMAHLAGILARPTIVLCGPTRGSQIFVCYGPHVRFLEGGYECSGCSWQAPYGPECAGRCPSICSILPQRVCDEVKLVLQKCDDIRHWLSDGVVRSLSIWRKGNGRKTNTRKLAEPR